MRASLGDRGECGQRDLAEALADQLWGSPQAMAPIKKGLSAGGWVTGRLAVPWSVCLAGAPGCHRT